MKILLVMFLFLLAGCGTLTQPIQETDKVLEQRLLQIEDATKRLKSEAIAEARDAAVDLVSKATKKLEDTGKEVISHAASELDSKLEKRLDQVDVILEKRIDQTMVKVEGVVDRQKNDATEIVRMLMRDEVPVMIESSVVKSADKIAERFGAVKKTTIGSDGVPMEVWALGGSGLLGTLMGAFQFFRNYLNTRAGQQRWSEKEIEEKVDNRVYRAVVAREINGSISNSGSSDNGSGSSFSYTSS
jgi:hypothetical protein